VSCHNTAHIDERVYCFDGRTVNARASCAGGLEFKSRTGLTLYSIANGSPTLQHICKVAVALALWRGDGQR